MRRYNTLIIDDENSSIERLTRYIQHYCQDLRIKGSATSVKEAIKLIKSKTPDLIFIDIELQDELSFSILEVLSKEETPEIIFISAHENYALQAIKYKPVNYLLKPFVIRDLIDSVNQAILKINQKDFYTLNSLAINNGDSIQFIDFNQILFLEADGNYTKIYTNIKNVIDAINNIGKFEHLLPSFFFRIHKKYIINLNFVKEIHRSNGFYCVLDNNHSLTVSRRKQKLLIKSLHL